MSRVSISRTIPHEPEELVDLMLDFQRYPSFVPGVVHIRLSPSKGEGIAEVQEVEAFLKNSKFSGTVRVAVEADRPGGRIIIKPRYGPFKILSASVNLRRLATDSTEVRFDAELTSSILAVNSLIGKYLRAATLAYAEVFIAELARRRQKSRALPA